MTRGMTLRASNAVTDDTPGLFTRVRSTQRFIIALIREGYSRSSGFRELVDVIKESNVIVFVQPAFCAGGRIRSCLVSVNGSTRQRHIRIIVDPHTTHDRLIATVAHELQHAVEIAEHPDIIDGSSALAFYRRIALGRCHDGLSEECETTRALATERRVLEELSAQTPGDDDVVRGAQREIQRGEFLFNFRKHFGLLCLQSLLQGFRIPAFLGAPTVVLLPPFQEETAS